MGNVERKAPPRAGGAALCEEGPPGKGVYKGDAQMRAVGDTSAEPLPVASFCALSFWGVS